MLANSARTRTAQHTISARDLSYELSLRADNIARRLLGQPNRKHSNKRELRWGNYGSLRVRIAGPKRGRWDDFEKGEGGDLLDLIRREQGCSFPDACDFACDELLGMLGDKHAKPAKVAARPKPKPELVKRDADRIRYALRIWHEAKPIIDTPGEVYSANRGIDLTVVPDIHSVLRWHPRCPWGEGSAWRPCIVALWTNILSGAPQAIHRRPITPEGEKVDPWKTLGPSRDCVIRLWPDDMVTTALVLGEGPKTVLAAATGISHRATLLQPAWAAGDAGHMRCFPVLLGIDAITLLVDHDPLDPKTKTYPGQDAATECARRWCAAGREVIRLIPRIVDTDFADIVAGEIAS